MAQLVSSQHLNTACVVSPCVHDNPPCTCVRLCYGCVQVGLDVLKYIHEHKTAALLEAAVVCGAITGGADDDTVEKLRRYALNIGLAFQVRDTVTADLVLDI